MSLDTFIRESRPLIEAELKQVVESINDPSYQGLRSMLAYHMGWEGEDAGEKAQGKRIRPLLVLLSTMAAGEDWQRALPGAAAVELIHNFSLIHDDIEDRSDYRHGRKTVWALWGNAQAINTGDCMFALAFHALNKSTGDPKSTLRAIDLLQETCIRLTKGQFLDMSYESRNDLPRSEYWNMVGGKTASLLACSATIGPMLTGVETEIISTLRTFAWNLGLAFQVQDDWLGIWGDSVLTGKSAESDLVNGKKSLPVILGLELSADFRDRWNERPFKLEEIPVLSDLLKSAGVQEMIDLEAKRLTLEAMAALENGRLSDEGANYLRQLAERLLTRKN